MTNDDVLEVETPEHFAGTIVAIGASAGGLEALDRFFSSLPVVEGAAFVVIQHLAPEHKTMMDTLLARHTTMRVLVAEDGTLLQSGHVYVIPPGATMTVSSGRLRLQPRAATGITLPIDAFFASLATEAASRAIGVVLSGTGSDGTRGAEALDAAGAWVLVQDPETAKFDGMPRSVIASGVVDQVLSPEAIAAEVQSILTSGERRPKRPPGATVREDLSPEQVLRLLAGVMHIDFTQYKPNTLMRRVERRLTATGCPSVQAYSEHLRVHADEVDTLRRELLIPVTSFFRDGEAFDALRERGLIPLLQRRVQEQRGDPLRVWVVATSTGEEAYSLAMLLLELVEAYCPGVQLKLFATDIEPRYLDQAARGRYTDAEMQGVSPERRQRWFEALEGGQWQVRPELRRAIVFSRHDVLSDAPFTQLDLVSCRNMLIYLRPAAQDRVVRRLSYALRPGGILFLGTSETPTAVAAVLETLESRQKVFRLLRRVPALPPDDMLISRQGAADKARRPKALAAPPESQGSLAQATRALLGRYAPPSMLVTPERELLHTFGDVERLLRIRVGEASLDLLTLLPPDLMPIVATLLHSAMVSRAPQSSLPVKLALDGAAGQPSVVRVSVLPLEEQANRIDSLLVCIEPAQADTAPPGPVLDRSDLSAMSSQQVLDLERELAATRSFLQDSMQELGTTNEELQATNEELMASNEELQSTNEELQSVNEELHTVNAELQSKIDELNAANADLESLSRAARIPLVFLDGDLRVTRFTVEARAMFALREGDIGRPITDFNYTMDYPDFFDDVRAAASTGEQRQKEVRDAQGRHWLMTLLPYASDDRRRTRLVITCVDVSSLRDVRRLQGVIDALPEHIAVLDGQGVIQIVNLAWRDFALLNGDAALQHAGIGSRYLDACRAAAASDPVARRVLQGLTGVLGGSRPAFMTIYPCHSPEEQRWFLMHVGPMPGGGAVVSHFNLTGWVDPARLQDLTAEGS